MTRRSDTFAVLDGDPQREMELLARLTTEESLKPYEVCTQMGLAWGAYLAWCNADEARIRRLKDALEVRGHLLAEDALRIADDAKDVGKARLQVDTRKWMAARMNPAWFGDRKDVNVNVGVAVDERLQESLSEILAKVVEGEVVVHGVTPRLPPAVSLEGTPPDQEI